MGRVVYTLIVFILSGCSHLTEDREVVCKVVCTNCEHVVHECNGVSDTKVTELE